MLFLFLGIGSIAVSFYGVYLLFDQFLYTDSKQMIEIKDYDPNQYDWQGSESSDEDEPIDDFSADESSSLSEKSDASSSTSCSNELRKVKKNRIRRLVCTKQDLTKWGIIKSIDNICDHISEQLKTQCLEDLKQTYLDNPAYQRNPIRFFRKLSRKRGPIRNLNIPQDLPILALHKLHETPEFLAQIYQDRNNLHRQMLKELKSKMRQ